MAKMVQLVKTALNSLDDFVGALLLRHDRGRHARRGVALHRDVAELGLLHQDVVVGVHATPAEVFRPENRHCQHYH